MFKRQLHRLVEALWYGDSGLARILLPLSWWVGRVVARRRAAYLERQPATRSSHPIVIVVGNITAGGTGKTPLVIAIVRRLQQEGHAVGVVLRGYGGRTSDSARVLDGSESPSEVGDESLIVLEATGATVAVCRQRPKAVRALAAQCDVVVSDDGLQHYAMPRHIELAVIDGQRCFGNGYLLPAGPLREPIERLDEVDMVVTNGGECGLSSYAMTVTPTHVTSLDGKEHRPLDAFSGQSVRAVAGIGNPQRFFIALRSAGIDVRPCVFPDHHQYTQSDFDHDDPAPILMTRKDAVKCQGLKLTNAWVVEAEALLSDAFFQDLQAKLQRFFIPH